MTLEQIKNRQQLLNDLLREHVRKSNALTDTILGSYPEFENDQDNKRCVALSFGGNTRADLM
jgi:hypothetical protein